MEAEYKQTQFGLLMIVVFLFSGVLVVAVALGIIAEGRMFSAIAMICFYLFGFAMFYSLTVEISDKKLKFWFGIGIFRKSYQLSEIQSTKEVIKPWYYFWGIKSIPGGWFYAIAPGAAVEITLNNGKIVCLGTNQPKILRLAIETAARQVDSQQM